jgi:lipoate-protein ligase B
MGMQSIFDHHLNVIDWQLLSYKEAPIRQQTLVEERIADSLILTEHLPVVTIRRSGSNRDLCRTESFLQQKGIEAVYINRGGQATYHGPDQLVAYPIVKIKVKDLHAFVMKLLKAASGLLFEYGLKTKMKVWQPGIWINNSKIASVGIAVKKWVTCHGLALNVNTDLNGFDYIVPCGHPGQTITLIRQELGTSISFAEVKERFVAQFIESFGYAEYVN